MYEFFYQTYALINKITIIILTINSQVELHLALAMELNSKPYQKGLILYRAKRRKNQKIQSNANLDNKSKNLKQIHRDLAKMSNKDRYSIENQEINHEKSLHNLLNSSSNNKSLHHQSHHHRNYSKKNIEQEPTEEETKLQKPVNFYINIQKLKNLKISNRDKRINQSFLSNAYMKKQTGISLDKKSLILRKNHNDSKGKNKSINYSYQNIAHSLAGKLLSSKKQNNSKMRYKTHQNQVEQENLVSDIAETNKIPRTHASQHGLIPKKSNFRRANNDIALKDKTFIDGYLRGKQLGRGGFSKVWQGFNFKTKQFYAIKEIDTTNKYQTHLTEIWFGNYFFQNGQIKKQFAKHEGVNNLLRMFQYSIVDPRAFIVYENCQGSLGNMLYDIYQEDRQDDIDQDDKLYMVKYKKLYSQLKKSCNFLKTMIYSIAQALDLLTSNRIVHSDIKTENILLKKTQYSKSYEFKLIDYGSSFMFESLKQYKLATPQYMCPELLNYILFENKKPCHQYMLEYVKTYQNISAIDVWGLGCITLQLIHGLPLWLSNKTKIFVNNRYQTKKGLFAVSDRSFTKILQKQLSVIKNFDQFLITQNNSGILIDYTLKQLIKGMLNPNPKFRLRPHQIIERLQK